MADRIVGIMLTLGRPQLLAQALRQWELQTYPDRHLLVIDTGNHIANQQGAHWEIRQLGRIDTGMWATVNEAVRSTDAEFVCRMDDDDIYLPWYVEAHVEALTAAAWSAASVVFDSLPDDPSGTLRVTRTVSWVDGRDVCYAGCWGYRRQAFDAVGGHPDHGVNEGECEFRDLLFARFGPPADTIGKRFPQPSYVYRRKPPGVATASALQRNEAETMRLRTMYREPVGKIVPRWPDRFIEGLPADRTIHERPW